MSELYLSECARKLEANLNRETVLYEELADLGREIKLAVEREDSNAFNQLLKKKNSLVAELQRVSEATDRLRQDFGKYRDVSDEIRTRVSEALGRAGETLGRLLRVERASEECFRAMKASIQTDLAEVARGRRVLEGYRARRGREPLFMDKRQ